MFLFRLNPPAQIIPYREAAQVMHHTGTGGLFSGLVKISSVLLQPGIGFSPRYYKGFDSVTIALKGSLARLNEYLEFSVIREGELCILVPGNGMSLLEYNPSPTEILECICFEIANQKVPSIAMDKALLNPDFLNSLSKNESSNYALRMLHYEKGEEILFEGSNAEKVFIIHLLKGSLVAKNSRFETGETLVIWDLSSLTAYVSASSSLVILEVDIPAYSTW